MHAYVIAAVWGFAEATLFFIVPDVWLTTVALRSPRRAVVASIVAALGAAAGGALMLAWATANPSHVLAAVEAVPAVSEEMIAQAHSDLQAHGLIAVLAGAFSGIPYKVFTAQVLRTSISPAAFLLFSVPARLARFILVSIAVAGIDRLWFQEWTLERKTRLLLAGWFAFYGIYFALSAQRPGALYGS